MHWNAWEKKGLTPPHEVQRGSQPRYVCAGGGKPYVITTKMTHTHLKVHYDNA
jgi:hypothetical protein